MEPNSGLLLAVLIVAAALCLVGLARASRLVARLVTGLLAFVLAAAAGIASVNDAYGYYQSWSQLSADLSGNYAPFAVTASATRRTIDTAQGQVESVMIKGARSGMDRPAFIYLPPQYFEKAYARTQFPVVELLHGTPGNPGSWLVHLKVAAIANQLIDEHRMGPTVLVMPTMSVGSRYEECVNAPGALDDTYITQEVRLFVETHYRVSRVPAEWGISGYSSGGYCAANLALRHTSAFGASAVIDGYYRPQDGPAAAALGHNAQAMAANDPIVLAAKLSSNTSPLPAFWVSTGTSDGLDLAGALAFTAALHGVDQVTLYREPGVGHTIYEWQPSVPHMLEWMWSQLAPPQLRVAFPIAGPVRGAVIAAHTPPMMVIGRAGAKHLQRHSILARSPRPLTAATTATTAVVKRS